MELFVSRVCCDIVQLYVGTLPYSHKISLRFSRSIFAGGNEWEYMIKYYSLDPKNIYSHGICMIKGCIMSSHERSIYLNDYIIFVIMYKN
jgi:hypothetical protein